MRSFSKRRNARNDKKTIKIARKHQKHVRNTKNTSKCHHHTLNKRCHFPGVGRFRTPGRKVADFRQVAMDRGNLFTKREKRRFFREPLSFEIFSF